MHLRFLLRRQDSRVLPLEKSKVSFSVCDHYGLLWYQYEVKFVFYGTFVDVIVSVNYVILQIGRVQ